MPGPAPKDPEQRARRNKTPALTYLPADGLGPDAQAPAWPLAGHVAEVAEIPTLQARLRAVKAEAAATGDTREAERLTIKAARLEDECAARRAWSAARIASEQAIWLELWTLPAAVEWQRGRHTRLVARYARTVAEAEMGDAAAAREARSLEQHLGLTPLAMLRLLWRVAEPEATAGGTDGLRSAPATRAHLRAVWNGEQATGT